MPAKTVFYDENDNQLSFHINKDGHLYIDVGQDGEDVMNSGYITLNKADVQLLIKELTAIEKEME